MFVYPVAMEERLSIRAFAKLKGVHESAVRRAIRSGRLPRSFVPTGERGGYIIPAIANAEWAANTHPSQGWNGQLRNAKEIQRDGKASLLFSRSRTAKERFKAQLARL